MTPSHPRTAAVIASAGRADMLSSTIDHLLSSVDGIDLVVVCVPDAASLPDERVMVAVDVVVGPRGAAAQRNAAVGRLPPSVEYVFFFDDDCLPADDYVLEGARHLDRTAACVGVTGRVLYDGAKRGPISPSAGLRILVADHGTRAAARDVYGLYGCNFAVRRSAVGGDWFDDRLPLYSWLEDEDLSRRLARRGALQVVESCRCVHLGASSGGRLSHLRFGYSQIVNPVYLRTKGSVTTPRMLALIAIPVIGNIRGLFGSQRRSRISRLRGDLLGLADVLRGRVTPERITTLREDPS